MFKSALSSLRQTESALKMMKSTFYIPNKQIKQIILEGEIPTLVIEIILFNTYNFRLGN